MLLHLSYSVGGGGATTTTGRIGVLLPETVVCPSAEPVISGRRTPLLLPPPL